MIITINDSKNCYPCNFIVGKEYYGRIKKYISLLPDNFDSRRFVHSYHSEKGKRQIIGKNKISKVPRKVAEYFELEHPEIYTGCFRRTAALLANLTAVKQLGGWRSSTLAEGYIEHSLANRRQIYQQIISFHQEISSSSTSNCQVPSATITNEAPSTSTANETNPKTNLNDHGMSVESFLQPDSDPHHSVPRWTEITNTSAHKSVPKVDSTQKRKLNEIRKIACVERLKKL